MESYKEPLLIVSHQAVLRCLYAYLMNLPRGQCPKLEIPLHTVMKITYDGWNPPSEERFILGPYTEHMQQEAGGGIEVALLWCNLPAMTNPLTNLWQEALATCEGTPGLATKCGGL